jgi:hypothetical protein
VRSKRGCIDDAVILRATEGSLGKKEERGVLRTIKRRQANWIGYMLRRNDHLKQVIEG